MDSSLQLLDDSQGVQAVSRGAVGPIRLRLPDAADAAQRRLWWRIVSRMPAEERPLQLGASTQNLAYIGDEEWSWQRLERAAHCGVDSDPQWQPYWIWAWESSLALAALLEKLPLTQKQVLDLGCGVGAVGTKCAMLGAYVVMADAVPQALLLARWNSWPWRDRVECRRLDWRCQQLPRKFDWILGADIIHEVQDWPCLSRFWGQHIAAGGRILLAEPCRAAADDFPMWASQHGWSVALPYPPLKVASRRIRFFELVPNRFSNTAQTHDELGRMF